LKIDVSNINNANWRKKIRIKNDFLTINLQSKEMDAAKLELLKKALDVTIDELK